MKAHFIFFSLAFLLVRPAFSQNGYTGYKTIYSSGLNSIPQQALDSNMFVIGKKGMYGVYYSKIGLIVPTRYDEVKILFKYKTPVAAGPEYNGRTYTYFKVKKGKLVGLVAYQSGEEMNTLLQTLYDSITYTLTEKGPKFKTYRNKVKKEFDPFAQNREEETGDLNFYTDVDITSEYKDVEFTDSRINEDPLGINYLYSAGILFEYTVFRYNNSKNLGVIRNSDSEVIVPAIYTSIKDISKKDLRFECVKNNTYSLFDAKGKKVVEDFKVVARVEKSGRSFAVINSGANYGLYALDNASVLAPIYSGFNVSSDQSTVGFVENKMTFKYFDLENWEFESTAYNNLISEFDNRYILAEVDSKIEMIDRITGKVVQNKKFTFNQTDKKHWAIFSDKKEHLLISLKTNMSYNISCDSLELIRSITEPKYQRADFCYLKFSKNNLYGLMDSTGKIIVEPKYHLIQYYFDGYNSQGKLALWWKDGNKSYIDAYFEGTKTWLYNIESAFLPLNGFELSNLFSSNGNTASVVKINGKYQHLEQYSTWIKIGKPVQIDSILFIGTDCCWIIQQNNTLAMWLQGNDSVHSGITSYKLLQWKNRQVLFLKQDTGYNMAFIGSRIHQLPFVDDVFMPSSTSFNFVLKKAGKLAIFTQHSFSEFVYDEIKIGSNGLIWVKMNGQWMVMDNNVN